MSETPAKKPPPDEDANDAATLDDVAADTGANASEAPDADETATAPAQRHPEEFTKTHAAPLPEPLAKEESSAPRAVPLATPPRPRAAMSPRPSPSVRPSPTPRPLPSARPSSSPSLGTRPSSSPNLSSRPRTSPPPAAPRTKTVRLPTPDAVAERLAHSEEIPSTEPSVGETDVDGTAATKPFDVEADDTTATLEPRRRKPVIVDEHTDDEGPTLIGGRVRPTPDEEATLVQPTANRAPSQPLFEGAVGPSEPDPLQAPPTPIPPYALGALSQRIAERELAVQAALAAASGLTEDALTRAARRDRQATTAAMCLLGAGMVLGALYGYLSSYALASGAGATSSASYASLTVLSSIALFLSGVAPLQRSTELKIAMVVMSGLLLLFTMVRMLTIAFG